MIYDICLITYYLIYNINMYKQEINSLFKALARSYETIGKIEDARVRSNKKKQLEGYYRVNISIIKRFQIEKNINEGVINYYSNIVHKMERIIPLNYSLNERIVPFNPYHQRQTNFYQNRLRRSKIDMGQLINL